MIIKVYSIFDKKAETYGPPFFMLKEQMAVRAFSDISNDMSTMLSKHPEDYELYEIGEYNDNTADIKQNSKRFIVNALSVKRVIKDVIDLTSSPIGNGKKNINKVEVA